MKLKDIVFSDMSGLKDKHCAFSSMRKLKVDLKSRVVMSSGGGGRRRDSGDWIWRGK